MEYLTEFFDQLKTILYNFRSAMMEGSGTLKDQLEATKQKSVEVRAQKGQLKRIEDLGAAIYCSIVIFMERSIVWNF
jgi:hypothetical protein